MSKRLSRHEIREMALQALFPLDFNANLVREDAIFNAIELDHRDMTSKDGSEFVPVYLGILVSGVYAKKDKLDKVVGRHLKNSWHINRVSETDLVILCIAVFEMTYMTDVPAAVTLSETIELAKTFSGDHSRRFVSGVLSSVLKELEART